jgi:hypothetical protein
LDLGERISFDPAFLYVRDAQVITMKEHECRIRNPSSNELLSIREIAAYSREVYVHEAEAHELGLEEEVPISICIYPLHDGYNSTVLLITTIFGMMTYSITYCANGSRDAVRPRNMYNLYSEREGMMDNVSFMLPSQVNGRLCAVDYDGIFFTDVSLPNDGRIRDQIEFCTPVLFGWRSTFVTLDFPTGVWNVPVYMVALPSVGSKGMKDIVINPSRFEVSAISVQLRRENF